MIEGNLETMEESGRMNSIHIPAELKDLTVA